MIKAYSYVRMSSTQQLKGASLKRQIELSEKYAAKQGWELETERYNDLGVSAFRGKHASHGQLAKFIKDCEDGKIEPGSVLIVESLDRISRQSPLDAIALFTRLLHHGLTIVTLADKQAYTAESVNRDMSSLYVSIGVLVRSHEESAIKSKRLTDVWDRKRRTLGSRKATAKCPTWLKLSKDKTTFEVIQERADIVVRIFELMASGLGNYSIAKQLNKEGVPTFREMTTGKKSAWGNTTIQRIVESGNAIGDYQPMKRIGQNRKPIGPVQQGYYPAIVSEELYYSALRARENRRKVGKGRKGAKFSNLFTGLAICESCGSTMGFVNKGPRYKGREDNTYLTCNGAKRGICDHNTHYDYDRFENLFFTWVDELDVSDLLPRNKNERQSLTAQLTGKNGKLEELKRQQADLLLSTLADGYEADAVQIAKSKLNGAVARTKKQIREIERQIFASGAATEEEASEYISEIEKIRELLAGATGNDFYNLRASLANQIRNVVKVIKFFDDGIIYAVTDEIDNHQYRYEFYDFHDFGDKKPYENGWTGYTEDEI